MQGVSKQNDFSYSSCVSSLLHVFITHVDIAMKFDVSGSPSLNNSFGHFIGQVFVAFEMFL